VALTFHNASIPYKYYRNRKGKKFRIGSFDCITVSVLTAATQNRIKVPFLENTRDPK
jgi:hypothetical protein